MAFSDSHGSHEEIERLIPIMNSVDYIFFLGDGSNDVKLLKNIFKDKIFAVRGNCDFSEDNLIEELVIENCKIVLTHGDLFSVKQSFDKIKEQFKESDVVFFGHTHSGFIDLKGRPILVNVPSLSFRKSIPGYVFATVNENKFFAKIVNLF